MRERTEYLPGTFCWVELATAYPDKALEFYSELFDWTVEETKGPEDLNYFLLCREGMEAAALYQTRKNIPARWLSYVSVPSVLLSIRKATESGGRLILGPQEIGSAGTMAMIQDPAGALIGFWQPDQQQGARITGEPGSFCWNELATIDSRRAGLFYSSVLGWTMHPPPAPDLYTYFFQQDRPAAGMFQMNKYWGTVPSQWIAYFAVEDCDASALKTVYLGGTIHRPPEDIPGIGRLSIVADSQDALFAIIKLETHS